MNLIQYPANPKKLHISKTDFGLYLNEFGNFLKFIYFSSFAILVNLPDQLVTVICDPALKN